MINKTPFLVALCIAAGLVLLACGGGADNTANTANTANAGNTNKATNTDAKTSTPSTSEKKASVPESAEMYTGTRRESVGAQLGAGRQNTKGQVYALTHMRACLDELGTLRVVEDENLRGLDQAVGRGRQVVAQLSRDEVAAALYLRV